MVEIENKYFKEVMEKMCSYVGADLNKTNPKTKDWFLEYSWTREQQEDFKNWLTDYLYSSNEARKNIMAHPRKTKKHCREVSAFFIFNYGWTTEKINGEDLKNGKD